MTPKICTKCGRPLSKCVCYDEDDEDEDEVAYEGAGDINEYGDDDYATPID